MIRNTNIDLLGRTYGVIHTAPDPDAGNTPRIVTALAHSHDPQGRRKSPRPEDGTVWQYDYNTRSEVTGAAKRQSNSDLVPGLDFGYSYDGLGNRLSASKGTPALVTEYEPDAMNRYSIITSPGGDDILVKSDTPVDVEVDEIPVGVTTSGDFRSARISADNSTTPAFPEISITGEDNFSESGRRWIAQAEVSPQYDNDGNLTNDGRWAYTWDAMNRLTEMTPTTTALTAGVPNRTLAFAYDHLGRRIAKKVTTMAGETTSIQDCRYLYEGWNVVAQFTADTSNDLTPDATYLWSLDLSGTFHGAAGVGGLHSVNLLSQSEGAKLCLACYDANGNIIAWTDTTGRVLQQQDYDPFGNRVIRERLAITTEQSERLEYGFSTKPLDAETGHIYYIHRYYGPRDGRWMSKDPIEELGGLNLYGFCLGNPVSRFDFLGFRSGGGGATGLLIPYAPSPVVVSPTSSLPSGGIIVIPTSPNVTPGHVPRPMPAPSPSTPEETDFLHKAREEAAKRNWENHAERNGLDPNQQYIGPARSGGSVFQEQPIVRGKSKEIGRRVKGDYCCVYIGVPYQKGRGRSLQFAAWLQGGEQAELDVRVYSISTGELLQNANYDATNPRPSQLLALFGRPYRAYEVKYGYQWLSGDWHPSYWDDTWDGRPPRKDETSATFDKQVDVARKCGFGFEIAVAPKGVEAGWVKELPRFSGYYREYNYPRALFPW